MALQRTLSIIKPDGLEKGVIGKDLTRFEDHGLKPVAMRMQFLSRREAEGFYAVHKERSFSKALINFMTSGTFGVMFQEGNSALATYCGFGGVNKPPTELSG